MRLTKLKRLIDKHDVKQTDLARVLGRDKAVVTNLIQGRRQMKADEAIKIAAFLGVSLTDVLADLLPKKK